MAAFAMVAALQHRASRPGWWWALAGLLPALLPWFHPRFSVLAAALGLVLAGRAIGDARPVRALASLLAIPAASAIGLVRLLLRHLRPVRSVGRVRPLHADVGGQGADGHPRPALRSAVRTDRLRAGLRDRGGRPGRAGAPPPPARLRVDSPSSCPMPSSRRCTTCGGAGSARRHGSSAPRCWSSRCRPPAAWASATHAVTRTVQAVALGVSVGISVMLLTVERGEFVFNVRGVEAPWLAWASQMADLAHAVPSLFRHGPLTALAVALVWTAAVVAAWLAARGAARAASLGPGSAALVAALRPRRRRDRGGRRPRGASRASSGTRVTDGQLRALETAAVWRGSRGAVLDSRTSTGGGPALERLRVGGEPAAAGSADVWMALPFLPAGRYRLWADIAVSAAFDVHLVAGRSEEPFESWRIERRGPGAVEPRPRAARRSVTRARAGRCGRPAGGSRVLAPAGGRRTLRPGDHAARGGGDAIRPPGGLCPGGRLPRAWRAVDGWRQDGRTRRAGGTGRARRGVHHARRPRVDAGAREGRRIQSGRGTGGR